jgi:hypothetical protein
MYLLQKSESPFSQIAARSEKKPERSRCEIRAHNLHKNIIRSRDKRERPNMLDFWLPPNDPFASPLIRRLPYWRFPNQDQHYIYQFLLNNNDKWGSTEQKPETERLSGKKRKRSMTGEK